MIPTLYIIGKILLIAVLLLWSFILIYFVVQSLAIKRELKLLQEEYQLRLQRDFDIYSKVSNFAIRTLMNKVTNATPINRFYFKLFKSLPFVNKLPNADELYGPVHSIIRSSLDIRKKLKK